MPRKKGGATTVEEQVTALGFRLNTLTDMTKMMFLRALTPSRGGLRPKRTI